MLPARNSNLSERQDQGAYDISERTRIGIRQHCGCATQNSKVQHSVRALRSLSAHPGP